MAIVLVFTGFVFAEGLTEKPLKDVQLDFAKVGCERLTYSIYAQSKKDTGDDLGEALGEAIMNAIAKISVELEVKVKKKEVEVYQKISMMHGFGEYSSVCKKNVFLSPRVTIVKGGQKNNIVEMKLIYDNGQVVYERDGQKKATKDFPEDTVIFMHLFRIVPQLPKDKGVKYTFEDFNRFMDGRAVKAQEGKRFGIVYMGPEPVEIEKVKYKLLRFDLVGDKYMCRFFVDDKRQVRFVKTSDSLMTLLTAEQVAEQEKKRKEQKEKSQADRQKAINDIHKVVWQAKVGDIKKLLDKDPEAVNRKNDRGETPLHVAVKFSKFEAVKLLVERGVDIMAVDNTGQVCLHNANDKAIIEYLADKEPKLMTVKSKMKRTPLVQMASRDALEDVEALLSKMSDGKERLKQMNDALLTAAYLDESNMVKYLIDKGADVNARDYEEYTAIIKCRNRKGKEVIELLCSAGAKINVSNKYGKTPLHRFADIGNVEAVKYLIEKGADVNAKDTNGQVPLNLIGSNITEIIEVLVAAGADVNARSNSKQTPLHIYASRRGNKDVVEYLLSKGAQIEAKDRSGNTALHGVYDVSIAELLISSGADIEAENSSHVTPLYRQAERGNVEIVKLLIKNEADIKKGVANIHHPLYVLHGENGVEIAKLFIDRGLDINMTSKDRSTPLHTCSQYGPAELIKYYLDVGANINARDSMGNLPIHKLAYQATSVAKVLIESGQGVNAKNNRGETPLNRVSIGSDIELIEYLISKGADVNAADKDGVKPLGRAIKGGKTKTIELLKKHGAEE